MKYDILNPMRCNRVVHDANNKQVMIPANGGKVNGVDMNDVVAKELIALSKKLGEGKELMLEKSADQPDQTKSNK